jgi:hypothetical protein
MPTREIAYVKCVMRGKITVRFEDGNGVGGEICRDYVGKRRIFAAPCLASPTANEQREGPWEAAPAGREIAIQRLR